MRDLDEAQRDALADGRGDGLIRQARCFEVPIGAVEPPIHGARVQHVLLLQPVENPPGMIGERAPSC